MLDIKVPDISAQVARIKAISDTSEYKENMAKVRRAGQQAREAAQQINSAAQAAQAVVAKLSK